MLCCNSNAKECGFYGMDYMLAIIISVAEYLLNGHHQSGDGTSKSGQIKCWVVIGPHVDN